MKAYLAWDCDSGENVQIIVFADNRQEAKKIAFTHEIFEDSEYINVRVRRYPEADTLYKGECVADWNDPETRIFLVKNLSWTCAEHIDSFCKVCPANEYCELF